MQKIDNIISKISSSPKYKYIYLETINRIVANTLQRFGEKRAEDEARMLLHQVWGVYNQKPNYKKILEKLIEAKGNREKELDVIKDALLLHLSTRERLGEAKIFFQKIFAVTGPVKSITDIGCGLNPLLYFFDTQNDSQEYFAYDIDTEEVNFLNECFKILNLTSYEVEAKDAILDEFPESDLTFLLKLVSPLELQKKNATINLINKIKSKFIVISYTTKTISGKNKGMKDFYSGKFEQIADENNLKYTKIEFESELVYVVEK